MKFILIITVFLALGCCVSSASFDVTLFVKNLMKSKASTGIIFKDCGSTTGVINSVEVTDCTTLPCKFQKGSNYTLTLNFNSKVESKSLNNQVYGVIAHIPVPFHLPEADGCKLGAACPIKNGDTITESVTLPILAEYPKLSLFVKWEVFDDSNKQMICFLFPVQIQ